jgi:hypothetical protein
MPLYDPGSIAADHLRREANRAAFHRNLIRSCGCARHAPRLGNLLIRAGQGIANIGCRISYGSPCAQLEQHPA